MKYCRVVLFVASFMVAGVSCAGELVSQERFCASLPPAKKDEHVHAIKKMWHALDCSLPLDEVFIPQPPTPHGSVNFLPDPSQERLLRVPPYFQEIHTPLNSLLTSLVQMYSEGFEHMRHIESLLNVGARVFTKNPDAVSSTALMTAVSQSYDFPPGNMYYLMTTLLSAQDRNQHDLQQAFEATVTRATHPLFLVCSDSKNARHAYHNRKKRAQKDPVPFRDNALATLRAFLDNGALVTPSMRERITHARNKAARHTLAEYDAKKPALLTAICTPAVPALHSLPPQLPDMIVQYVGSQLGATAKEPAE